MKSILKTKSVHEALEGIRMLDLGVIKDRMIDAELGLGWTREYAEGIEAAYKDYLVMLVKHPAHTKEILVSNDVDEFWHTHILHTAKYMSDCESIFGSYLHHNPQPRDLTKNGVERRAAMVALTQRLCQNGTNARGVSKAAWCNAAVKAQDAAWCNAAVKAQDAAWCNAAVKAQDAAWCNAAVKAQDAAWCNAAVKAQDAAWCNAAVKAQDAAWCNAVVKAQDAAWCNAAVKAQDAAWCNAAVKAQDAAWCNAAVKAQDAAWCNAAVKT